MRKIVIFLLVLTGTSCILRGQTDQSHLQVIAEEYCQGILGLPAVDTSSWWIETLDTELPSLPVSEAAKAAFRKAEGMDFSEALEASDRLPLQLFGKVFEACPTIASRRMLEQQVASGGYFSVMERPEWREIIDFLRIDIISDAMDNDEELLSIRATQAIKDSLHSEAFDTLIGLTSSTEIYPLLFTALSATEPKVMGRYQLESHDGERLMAWVMANSPDSLSSLIGMDADYHQLCNRIEKVVDSLGFDLSQMDRVIGTGALFQPRAESVDRLDVMYEAPVVNRGVLISGTSGMLLIRLFQECGYFRNLIKEHAFEAAMKENDVVGEEKEMYYQLVDDLCGCMQLTVQAESMECFEKRMNAFGLSEENTQLLEAAENPEVMRKMNIFQTLMPAIGGGCTPKFEE